GEQTTGRLEVAMALLLKAEAAYVARRRALTRNRATGRWCITNLEWLRRNAEADRISAARFARIEALLLENTRLLVKLHVAIVEMLSLEFRHCPNPCWAGPCQSKPSAGMTQSTRTTASAS